MLHAPTTCSDVFVILVSAFEAAPLLRQDKPNIVLINLDDADTHILSDETLALRYPNLATLAKPWSEIY